MDRRQFISQAGCSAAAWLALGGLAPAQEKSPGQPAAGQEQKVQPLVALPKRKRYRPGGPDHPDVASYLPRGAGSCRPYRMESSRSATVTTTPRLSASGRGAPNTARPVKRQPPANTALA